MKINEDALKQQNQSLSEQIELMRKLGTREGFFNYFFSILKNFKTKEEAFYHVNDIYYDFYGEFRFSDYDSFKKCIKYYFKKNKKS